MPPLTWFRAFEAAARCLSFTGAASELGMTQSAVSQQIRLLEQRLGVALFRRLARGIELTDEGRRLIPKVSGAIETLEDVTREFDSGSEGPDLTIAASVSMIQWYLAPGLPRFRRRHPQSVIRLINTTWPDEFHRPIADVEIRFGSEAMVGKGATRLTPDESILVAAPGLTGDLERLDAHLSSSRSAPQIAGSDGGRPPLPKRGPCPATSWTRTDWRSTWRGGGPASH